MSVTAMAWAWTINGLGPDPKFVLMALADQADDTGYCWPSQRLIAQRVEMGERTVRRHLKTLQEVGLLTAKVRSSTGGRRSNAYYLHIGSQPDFATHADPDPAPQPSSDESPEASKPVDNSSQGLPVNMTGRGESVENSSVDNSGESGLSGSNTATGQFGRLRKRPDRPVALEANGGRSLEANSGRLQYKNHHKNHQTLPDPVPHQPGDQLAMVGSGQDGAVDDDRQAASAASPASAGSGLPRVGGGDAELIAACLPSWMHPMDAPGAAQVAALLRERVEAGWSREQIAALMDGPQPPTVRRLSSLVGYRLRENVHPELAPTVLSRPSVRSQDKRDRQRAERADALAQVHHEVDPAWDAALDQARKDMPQASWAEVAVAARRLLADTTTAVPARPDRGTPPAAA